jgi:hypothetical protein
MEENTARTESVGPGAPDGGAVRPSPGAADSRLLTLARLAHEAEVGEYLERIVQANASRIQGDFRERVRESRWCMQAEIKALLRNISASAERALGRARERRAAGTEAIQIELSRIERLHRETEALMPPPRMEPIP